jgi:hypothetical protein
MHFLNFDLGAVVRQGHPPPALGWILFPIVHFCASYDYQIEHLHTSLYNINRLVFRCEVRSQALNIRYI